MNILLFLEREKSWCEENAKDQQHIGNERNAAWWNGRAHSCEKMLTAVRQGVVTPNGIEPLEYPE